MSQIIGFTGPHRTGKTATAKELASRLDKPFVPTSVGPYILSLGYEANRKLPYKDRLYLQQKILWRCVDMWEQYPRSERTFITDRTPLDIAAYLINDSIYLADRLYYDWMDFLDDCVSITETFFSHLLLVQPAGILRGESDKSKGFPSRVIQTCMNFSFKGLLDEVRAKKVKKTIIPAGLLFDETVDFCFKEVIGSV